MTTEDYLTQLQQDREDLVDNLEAKGITGLTGNETFTELVPEVLNIPSGGGNIPADVDELNQKVKDISKEFDDYLNSLPDTYETYTSDNVTLYTPNADYKHYIIRQKANTRYGIAWISTAKTPYIRTVQSDPAIYLLKIWENAVYGGEVSSFQYDKNILSITYQNGSMYYSNSDYGTVDECINAIQSNTTSYTFNSSTGLNIYVLGTPIAYTNTYVFKESDTSPFKTTVILSKRISSNETIEVIS